MNKEVISFGNIETEKLKFHHPKNLILLQDVDIDNIQMSSMISSGEKNQKQFIGYKDNDDYTIKQLQRYFRKLAPM